MIDMKLKKQTNSFYWKQRLLKSICQASTSLLTLLPVVLGALLLTSLIIPFIPKLIEGGLFGRSSIIDALTGAGVGSIAAGQPLISYLLGGELLSSGVSLIGVTALLVTWVTVGIIHLPVEAAILGRRFAIYRIVLNFLFALIIAFITTGVLHVLG